MLPPPRHWVPPPEPLPRAPPTAASQLEKEEEERIAVEVEKEKELQEEALLVAAAEAARLEELFGAAGVEYKEKVRASR